MKFIKSINELKEARQAPAKKLFKMVVKGSTSEIEGQKISKEMAQAALDWFDRSTYARKYEKQVKSAGMGAIGPMIFGDYWGIKKTIPSKLKAEFKELQQVYKREVAEGVLTESDASPTYPTNQKLRMFRTGKKKSGDWWSILHQSPTMMLAQEIEGAEFHHGFGDGTTVDARSTKKTWEDGVPVLKYIARAPKKSVKLPKGKFEVVIDDKYGWIYWQDKGIWYGMEKEDDYIPFEF